MSSLGVLNKLLEFEVALGDFYTWLSGVFQYDREVSATFTRLSIQEQGHANLVRHKRKMATLDGSMTLPGVGDVNEVGRLVDQIEQFRAASSDPDLCKSIELAIAVEKTAAFKLHRSSEAVVEPGRISLVEKLATDGLKHTEVLEALRARILGMAS